MKRLTLKFIWNCKGVQQPEQSCFEDSWTKLKEFHILISKIITSHNNQRVVLDFPGDAVGKTACSCRGHGYNPCLGKFHTVRTITKLVCCDYWGLHTPEVCAPQQEKPPQWEAHAPQPRVAFTCRNKGKPAQRRPSAGKDKWTLNEFLKRVWHWHKDRHTGQQNWESRSKPIHQWSTDFYQDCQHYSVGKELPFQQMMLFDRKQQNSAKQLSFN